ncbi:FAD-binding protein [Actinopolymorpha pittospori]
MAGAGTDQRGIQRRALLTTTALAAVGGLVGCGSGARTRDLAPADGGSGTRLPTAVPAPPNPVPTTPSSTPTPADWKALAESLSGKLLRPGDAGYPAAHQLFDPAWDSVLPAAVSECADPADVATTLKFAERFKLPLTSKSGGHSYVGASTTSGGIVISVSPMNSITFSGTTAQVGAGAPLVQVYSALEARNRIIPAGSCPSVGVAGLTLGGGLSLANRVFGLTCDTVTQVQVVTADGKMHTANPSTEPNLYWACRGGGGGTLGVVTAFWFRTEDSPLIGTFSAQWRWTAAAAVVRGWQRYMETASEEVWASLRLTSNANGTLSARVFGVDVSNDPSAALDKLISAVGVEPEDQTATKNKHFSPDPPSGRVAFYAGTDILGQALPASGITALLEAMNGAAKAGVGATAIFDPLGGEVARQAVNATAFPWRKAFASIQWYSQSSNAKGARAWIASGHKAVASWAVGGYVNYLEANRTNGSLYFGPNLAKLASIKKTYDPNNVFKLPYTL